MRTVLASPYLRAIAAVICISSLVTTLTGWQFLAIAQQALVKKDAVAIFLGNFNFYAGIFSLLFQLLLTTRFLRRFGIGTALFVLPGTVFLGSAGLLAFGNLSAALTLKSCDQVLRYSLDKSTAELLYLPLPARVKIQVKWFIDTVVWRLGDGLSGLTVLLFATTLHWPARQVSWAGPRKRRRKSPRNSHLRSTTRLTVPTYQVTRRSKPPLNLTRPRSSAWATAGAFSPTQVSSTVGVVRA